MRMWMIDPQLMCNKHLLGEHVETHMLAGSMKKGRSMAGFITGKLVDLSKIGHRHDALASEMSERGMNHKSPLFQCSDWIGGSVDEFTSVIELKSRCAECRDRIEEAELAISSSIGIES